MGQLAMIQVAGLHKTYGRGTTATRALKGVNLEVQQGEFVALIGRSGSGKSTLLHILGLLDSPTYGQFTIHGRNMLGLTEAEKARCRLRDFGYVFQEFSLLPTLTLLENVSIPAIGLGRLRDVKQRATSLLSAVGLQDRLHHHPREVSGGEQQRAAIARALMNQPRILFADEPTASLDLTSARTILDLFGEIHRETGQTIVMVTHEPGDEAYVDRVIRLNDGVVDDSVEDTAPTVLQ